MEKKKELKTIADETHMVRISNLKAYIYCWIISLLKLRKNIWFHSLTREKHLQSI